jgi:hypothetical protein
VVQRKRTLPKRKLLQTGKSSKRSPLKTRFRSKDDDQSQASHERVTDYSIKTVRLCRLKILVIHISRFQNIISKIDNRRTEDEKIKICERYKKTVEPVELTRYKPTCPAHKMKAKSEANKKKIGKKKTSTKKDQDQEGSSQSSPVSGGQCQLVCKLI